MLLWIVGFLRWGIDFIEVGCYKQDARTFVVRPTERVRGKTVGDANVFSPMASAFRQSLGRLPCWSVCTLPARCVSMQPDTVAGNANLPLPASGREFAFVAHSPLSNWSSMRLLPGH